MTAGVYRSSRYFEQRTLILQALANLNALKKAA